MRGLTAVPSQLSILLVTQQVGQRRMQAVRSPEFEVSQAPFALRTDLLFDAAEFPRAIYRQR